MNKENRNIAVLCRDYEGVKNRTGEIYESWSWVMKPELYSDFIGGTITLHQKQSSPSYEQGEIIGMIKDVNNNGPKNGPTQRVIIVYRKVENTKIVVEKNWSQAQSRY